MRPATRERVERAIDELGYRPHASARRLRTRRSATIGIRLAPTLNGISGMVMDRFLHDLTAVAAERQLRILLYTARSAADEIEQIRHLSMGADVDGIVLVNTVHHDERIHWLLHEDIPFVSFGRPWGEPDMMAAPHPWVDVDGAGGTAQATAYALDRGARRVAFLGWPSPSGSGDDRARGWRQTIDERGGERGGPRLAVVDEVTAAKSAVTAALLSPEPPDAMVCVSDTLALGARLAAVETGRGGLLIVGYDNTSVIEALGLSSVDQRTREVARGALDLLTGPDGTVVHRSRADRPAGHVLVTPALVVR